MSNHHMLTRRKTRSEALSSAPEDSSEAVTNPKKRKRQANSTWTSARGKKKVVVEQSETPTVVPVAPQDSATSESQNLAIITTENSAVLKENGSSSSGSKRARSSPSNSVLRRSSRARKKSVKILENEGQEKHKQNDAMPQNLANGEGCSQFGSGKDAMQLVSKDHHQGDLDDVTLQEERQETQPEAAPQQPVVQAASNNDCQTTCKAIVLFSGNHQNMEITPVTDNSNITSNPKGRSKLQARRKSSLVQSCRGIKEATLRWKRLAESILKEKLAISVTDSQISSQNRTGNKARQNSEKQKRKRFRSSAKSKEKPGVPRKMDDLLKQMGSWLTDARFPQIETETEKAFTMNDDDRGDFAIYMVKACEKDSNLRNVLLESVRILVESGVMHSAASALVQEGPCKEAESVLSAWQDYQKNKNEFPLGVLNAVNQLHDKKDLTDKLSILRCSDRLTFDQTENAST